MIKRIRELCWKAFCYTFYAFVCVFIDPDDRPFSTRDTEETAEDDLRKKLPPKD